MAASPNPAHRTAAHRIAARFATLAPPQQRAVHARLQQEGLSFDRIPVVPRPAGTAPSFSSAQLRQWFLWQMDPAGAAYHIAGALRLRGALDEAALATAVTALVAHHDALRTVFVAGPEGARPEAVPAAPVAVQRIDVSGEPAGDRERLAREAAARVVDEAFDLARAPLLRAALVRLAPDEHCFVLAMHHVASDGASLRILLRDFIAAYRAAAEGRPLALAAAPVSLADHAAWQRSWLDAGERTRQLAYWRAALGPIHPVLQLPTDRPRRADGRYRAARHAVLLPAPLVAALRQRAQAEGGTLFMALLAGFQVLLARYAGQPDVRVGVPMANRHRTEIEDVVGLFVNTVVMRNLLADTATLGGALAQAREAALGAQAHQDLPFEQLVEDLQPERSLGGTPLFQVMFNHLREASLPAGALPGLAVEELPLPPSQALVELLLDTRETADGGVRATFVHAAELFEPATVQALAERYVRVLEALAGAPQTRVSDLDLTSDAERAMLRAWGEVRRRAEPEAAIHQLFERQAAARPQAVAVVAGETRLTYAALDRRANQLAHRLRALGAGTDSRVGLLMPRGVDVVAAMLAVLKAGAAYLPLDPAHPRERLAATLRDAGVRLLLTSGDAAQGVDTDPQVAVLRLDTLDLSSEPARAPGLPAHPDQLAYVIYTSGSTGRPKGAQLAHRQVTRLLRATDGWFGFGPDDTWTLFHSVAFDFSVWEIFGALCTGGRLVVVDPAASRSPQDFAALLAAEKVTVLNQTPSAFGALLRLPGLGDLRLSLRVVIFGGEALDPQSLRPWMERFGDAHPRLVNMYGITETTVHVTYRPLTRADLDGERSPVGTAIPDLGLRVLDERLRETPVGVPGELHVSGEGLARGYLNRAGLTAERFIADPFDAAGGRLYRTGDLVRWNAQGQLDYLGRIDHQVKLRGFRIELGEIESQLLAQPGVSEAIVLALPGPAGHRLVGYVGSASADDGLAARLKARLGQVLPDYMVPAALVVLPALPLNANGKVDRTALPVPLATASEAYEPPRGPVETALAALWAELLAVERVGRLDHFFERGGHSLLALSLLERLRQAGWSAQVRSLFQWPRLADFAATLVPLDAGRDDAADAGALIELPSEALRRIEEAVDGGATNLQDVYPLMPLQEGLLFHHLMVSEGDAYVTSHALAFDGEPRLRRFVDALGEVVARHDILRTAVVWEGLATPVQAVWRAAPLRLESLPDAAALDAATRPGAARIDVRRAPMLRALSAFDAASGRWRLTLLSHHLVSDHTTLDRMVDEITLITQGRRDALPAPVPFRRFVARSLENQRRGDAEAFFRGELGDLAEPTIAYGVVDVRGDGSAAEDLRWAVDEALAARLREGARRHGVSAAAVFHLAWALVLGKATGRDDVVFGTVLFGRLQAGPGADRALGLFINTLPIRVRLGTLDAGTALARTQRALTGLLHHEHTPLSAAQRCSALPAGAPLFTSLLNYRHGAREPVVFDGMTVLGSEERSNYPLGLSVDDVGDGFRLAVQCDAAIGAARCRADLDTVLLGLAEALGADRPVGLHALDRLSAPERAQLRAWGDRSEADPALPPVHHTIAALARTQPEAVAVVFDGEHHSERLTYAELDARANQLAHRLIARGVRPEARVGIAVERSLAMVVGLLGILKAGAAWVPLDPQLPAERLRYMAEDSAIALLLTHGAPPIEAQQVLDLADDLSNEPTHDPQVPVHPEQLVYAIYTSGSTGRPKGAANRHGSLARCMAWMQATYGLGAADAVLHKAPFGFDVSVWELFWPLTAGSRLVLARPGDQRDPERIVQLIREHGITTLNFVPAMLQAFLAHEGIEAQTRLRYVICGGEAMPAATQREALRRLKGVSLQNLYGPTETTIHVTQWTCRDDGRTQVPIGRPISGTRTLVLDGQLNEVPAGVAGELYLGGVNLGRGYLGKPGLTSERFVADEGGERLYRTGDLVRWNGEGQLEYLGRIDHQVKVRGFRIELGEVEAQLLAQPEVREAVVVAQEARLVAYVAMKQALDEGELKRRLGQTLPEYMLPSVVMVLEALPLNANGKVDRQALPAASVAERIGHEAPEGDAEEALAAVWCEVLGVERIGRHDHFFELGGDSISSLKVIALARRHGSALTLQQLFAHPTLAAAARAGQGAVEAIPALGAAARAAGMALSPAQARQWFLWQLDPSSAAYHITGALRIEGALDRAALQAAFDALVARHEALRTVFRTGADGLAEQLIAAEGRVAIEPLADEAAMARVCETPFDLTQGPLLRVGLATLGPREHRLVVVMHHIVSDGWSMQVIVEEFCAAYRAHVAGEPLRLAPLPLQYADCAAWQRGLATERQLAWWTQALGREHPVLQLPTDRPRRADGRYRVAHHVFELDPSLVAGLRHVAQSQGGTLYMALLAGFQVLLHRHTGQEDVRVGVPIANRQRAQTQGVVGFFVNTQVMRAQLSQRLTLRAVFEQVKAMAQGAQANQDLPFEQLVEALQPERSLGGTPLFQVMFNHQRADARALQSLPGLRLRPEAPHTGAAQFELTLDTTETAEGRVVVTLSHAVELFEAQTIERMAGHYEAVLRALAADAGTAVGDVLLQGDGERRMLAAWRDNPATHGEPVPVHRLIERQVAATPQAVALAFGEATMSYAALDAQANRLAHRLIASGVRPEQPVGLLLSRSFEMVVALLAVMKAGAAWVPLDPDHPAERLASMREDSGLSPVLTQSWHAQRLAGGDVVVLDGLDLSAEPAHAPDLPVHPEQLAYVIYTSGSTGRPKGAANRHGALFNRLAWMQQAHGLGPGDTVLQKTPYGFDVSVWEFLWPLMQGARLAIAPPDAHRDPAQLVGLIVRHGVTTLHFVPSMLQAFLVHEGIEACTSLRRIVCSGEALAAQAQQQVFARLPWTRLYNLYGPTEAAIDVTQWTCRDDGRTQVPIGRPISGTRTVVLDGQLNEVPAGIAGELYLGGLNLGRGYLGKPGLTSERFVADEGGERLYRTGDLVRWNSEGQLEYLGRLDHQVKVRGFRIELGEIEAQLLAQPEVREAVVVAQQMRLVAYLALKQALDEGELKRRLSQTLPEYMLPSVVTVLEALPLNANGKVDRQALPAAGVAERTGHEAPQGEFEELLAAVWCEVLGVERIGRHDHFFELGGHSLMALQMLEKLRARGRSVPVRLLFQHPRLAGFAQAVAGEEEAPPRAVPPNGIPAGCTAIAPAMLPLVTLTPEHIGRIEAMVPGGSAGIQDIYPLAPLQEGILFHHLLQGEGDAYVGTTALAFDTRERLTSFIAHLNAVIARHDVLRTAVLWDGLPEPVQVVWREARLALEWLDDATQLEAAVDPRRHRLDVRRAPMMRTVAARDGECWRLQLATHHLVLDHTTLERMVEEIGLIRQGRAAELPASVPYRQHVAQALAAGGHEAFFRRMLGDVTEPTAPFDRVDVQGDGSGVEEARQALDDRLARELRHQAQRQGVSAATLFHLAFALVLARTTGREDVVFGTVLFGRMQGDGAQRALGLFINTLPLRVRLGNRSVGECVRETQASLGGLLRHEHAKLSLAQRCSALAAGTPLFSALLNYRHGAGASDPQAWEGISVIEARERTNYPLALTVDDLGEGFVISAQADAAMGAQAWCARLDVALRELLAALDAGGRTRAGELRAMTSEDRARVAAWSRQAETEGEPLPVHHTIAALARTQPDAVAVVFDDAHHSERLTYADLDARANQLAHRLIARGVRPEARVGIAVERSLAMVVGLLGILKAGAAWVPLDPQLPAERLRYMAEDSAIALLLTHGAPPIEAQQVLDLADDLSNEPTHDPQVPVHPEQLVYVIYTSGSTGRPKGAANRHGSLARCMAWMQATYGLGAADAVLHKAPFGFDVSVWELFWPLTAGSRLVLARPGDQRDPERIVQLIREHGITTLNFVPAMLQAFLAHEGIEAQTRLRYVICGGEAMPAATQREALRRLQGVSLQNLYGPTETTIHVTQWTCRDDGRTQVPIGRPISGTRTLVLDGQLNEVPAGVAGELYLGGANLGRGYLGKPGLTSERFVADEGGERLYRTGDLVRWNDEGQLEYLGRLDHQVKVRGFRIELGEVEAQLLAQPEVREAVVVAQQTRLIAYVALKQDLDDTELKRRLSQTLPEYMLPSVVMVLEALPLNANGKVDRQALPQASVAERRNREAPQGEFEELLAEVWCEVLSVERIGRHDHFFELGGHSLALLPLKDTARREWGVDLPLRAFFEQPTLAGQASLVRAAVGTDTRPSDDVGRMSALLAALED